VTSGPPRTAVRWIDGRPGRSNSLYCRRYRCRSKNRPSDTWRSNVHPFLTLSVRGCMAISQSAMFHGAYHVRPSGHPRVLRQIDCTTPTRAMFGRSGKHRATFAPPRCSELVGRPATVAGGSGDEQRRITGCERPGTEHVTSTRTVLRRALQDGDHGPSPAVTSLDDRVRGTRLTDCASRRSELTMLRLSAGGREQRWQSG
jgi:hypothetical protein